MNRVLLIRPMDDALPLAKILKSKGIESLLYPLFTPRFLPFVPLKDPQAFIITSKNALRALEGHKNLREVPLYVVGDQSAQLAKKMGFSNVVSALGTSQELIQLILNHARHDAGILWHLSGERIKENIVQALQAKGFKAERKIVYCIEEIAVDPSLFEDLQNQKISHVMFFSPHTTQIFIHLLKKKSIEKVTSQMIALCLSQDIAEETMSLDWKKIWISPRPATQNMVEYFNDKK